MCSCCGPACTSAVVFLRSEGARGLVSATLSFPTPCRQAGLALRLVCEVRCFRFSEPGLWTFLCLVHVLVGSLPVSHFILCVSDQTSAWRFRLHRCYLFRLSRPLFSPRPVLLSGRFCRLVKCGLRRVVCLAEARRPGSGCCLSCVSGSGSVRGVVSHSRPHLVLLFLRVAHGCSSQASRRTAGRY